MVSIPQGIVDVAFWILIAHVWAHIFFKIWAQILKPKFGRVARIRRERNPKNQWWL